MVWEENDKVDKEDNKEFDKEQNKVGENKEVILKRTLEKEKSGVGRMLHHPLYRYWYCIIPAG